MVEIVKNGGGQLMEVGWLRCEFRSSIGSRKKLLEMRVGENVGNSHDEGWGEDGRADVVYGDAGYVRLLVADLAEVGWRKAESERCELRSHLA